MYIIYQLVLVSALVLFSINFGVAHVSSIPMNADSPKKIICKLSDSKLKSYKPENNGSLRQTRSTSSDTAIGSNSYWRNTVNPQNDHNHRRSRYRGQTQSQYLNIGTSDQQAREPGKAEAESFYEGSRAIVSGNSGMGQAQSQSNVSPDCEPCYGSAGIRTNDQTQIYNTGNGQPSTSNGGIWPGQGTNYIPSTTSAYPGNFQTPGLHHAQGSGTHDPSRTQGTQTVGQYPTSTKFQPNKSYQPQDPGMDGTQRTQAGGRQPVVQGYQPTGPYQPQGSETSGTQGTQTGGQSLGAPGFHPTASYQPQGPGMPGISETQWTQIAGQRPFVTGYQPAGPYQPQSLGTSGTQGSQIENQHLGSPGFPPTPAYHPQSPGTYGPSGTQETQTGGQTPGAPGFQHTTYQPQRPGMPGTSESQWTQIGDQQPVRPGYQPAEPYQFQGPGTSGTQGTQILSPHPGAPTFPQTSSYQPQGSGMHGPSGTKKTQTGGQTLGVPGLLPTASYQPQRPGISESQLTQTGGQHPVGPRYQPTGTYQPQGSEMSGTQGTQTGGQSPGAPGFQPSASYQPQGLRAPGISETQLTQTAGQLPFVEGYQPAGPYQPQGSETSKTQGTQIVSQHPDAPIFPQTVPYQPQLPRTHGPIGTQGTQTGGQTSGAPGLQPTASYQPQRPGISESQLTQTRGQHPVELGYQPTEPHQPRGPETSGIQGTQTGGQTLGAPGLQPTVLYQPERPGTPGVSETQWTQNVAQPTFEYQPAGPYQPQGPEISGGTPGSQMIASYPGALGFSQTAPYQPQSPETHGPSRTQGNQMGGQIPATHQPQRPGISESQWTQTGPSQHPVGPIYQPTEPHQLQSPGTSGIQGSQILNPHPNVPGFQMNVPYQPQGLGTQGTSGTQRTQTQGQIPKFQPTASYQPQRPGTAGSQTQWPQTGGQNPLISGYPTAGSYQPQGPETMGIQGNQKESQHPSTPGFPTTLANQPLASGMPETSGTQWTQTKGQDPGAPRSQQPTSFQHEISGTPKISGTQETQSGGHLGVKGYQPTETYRPQGPETSGLQGAQTAGGFPGASIGPEGSGQFPTKVPGNWRIQESPESNPSNLPSEATRPLATQFGGNISPPATSGGSSVPGLLKTDYTGVNTGAAGSNGQDDGDSQAEANVQQGLNETTASASSQGRYKTGKAQTQVSGVYSGSGSFSAQAQIIDENKGAQSQVNGNKQGATSSSQGSGGRGQSQAKVQLGSESGGILTESQSGGANYLTNTQVQGSYKGGMADSQANGPGSTSSQAQIGFTPYQSGENEEDIANSPFTGSGSASSQSGSLSGQSQTQIHGKFRYGISYNGAAQAASSGNKESISKNRVPFNPINVFDTSTEYIQFGQKRTKIETETPVPSRSKVVSQKSPVSTNYDHTHSDHHEVVQSYQPQNAGKPNGIIKQEPAVEYDDETTDTRGDEEFENYNTDETHQAFTSPSQSVKKKQLAVNQSKRGNTQHIIVGSLDKHDAEIIQDDDSDEIIDDERAYEPGEVIPDTQGYAIPMGFRGHLSSVSSKDNTYARGGRNGHSQAQTVNLTPGSERVIYTNPRNSYDTRGRYVQSNNLRSLSPRRPPTRPEDDSNYISVSKSVTGSLDSNNNLKPQYSHTYYTKSSSCGYFTFTCNIVNGSNGRTKVCKPKVPTNPDGTPIQC